MEPLAYPARRSTRLAVLACAVIVALVASGCSRGSGGEERTAQRDPRATAAPGTDAENGEGGPGGDTNPHGSARGDAGGGFQGDAGSGGDGHEPEATPEPPPPEGLVYPPRRQHYVYQVSGERKTPSMSAPAPYPAEARLEWRQHEVIPVPGVALEFSYRGTLAADDAEFEERIWYQREGLRRVFSSVKLPDGVSYSCRFAPPIAYANFPVEPGSYASQRWSGSGCSGTTQVTVVGAEPATDANGTSYSTWKIEERTTYRIGSAQGTLTLVRWLSDYEGVDVRAERTDEGVITGEGLGGAAPKPYNYRQTLVLESFSD